MMTNHHGQSLLPHKYSSRTTADSLMLRICLLSGERPSYHTFLRLVDEFSRTNLADCAKRCHRTPYLSYVLLAGILTFGISEVGGHPGSRVRRGGSATSAPVDCGSDRHGRSQCVCVPTGECKRCDAFELALETESDDTNWCTATGYKQLVHCVDADDHESDTYQRWPTCGLSANRPLCAAGVVHAIPPPGTRGDIHRFMLGPSSRISCVFVCGAVVPWRAQTVACSSPLRRSVWSLEPFLPSPQASASACCTNASRSACSSRSRILCENPKGNISSVFGSPAMGAIGASCTADSGTLVDYYIDSHTAATLGQDVASHVTFIVSSTTTQWDKRNVCVGVARAFRWSAIVGSGCKQSPPEEVSGCIGWPLQPPDGAGQGWDFAAPLA
eukprot:m.360516 g.360516  ORF g.360516 m.360516 type:complete len:386 (-) comp20770_c0_seq2:203-1360(-)